MDEDDADLLQPKWRDWITRFPTPADAMAAARQGEATYVEYGDMVDLRLDVVIEGSGNAAIRETVYLPYQFNDVIDAALANAGLDLGSGTPTAHFVDASRAALQAITSDAGVSAGPVTVEQSQFGWARTSPDEGWVTWEDSVELPAFEFALSVAYGDDDPHVAKLRQDLAGDGYRIVICETCGHDLTDRHPEWLGTYVSFDEYGPACTEAGRVSYGRYELYPPHQPRLVTS